MQKGAYGMAEDPGVLTPAAYDPWRVATPLQLLQLIQRLGVSGRVIARQVGVKPSAVSMWSRGKRPIPLSYTEPLRLWARHALGTAAQLNVKEVAAQPTAELQRMVQAEFGTIWDRWRAEVLYSAGTLDTDLLRQHASLGTMLRQRPFTPDDREHIKLALESILAKVDRLMGLQPEVLSAEEALIERLTQAHEGSVQDTCKK
jgi:transcriptional regulator with XRE-family HTH domain